MKRLPDQNLGPSLTRRLADLGCEIRHVEEFGLDAAEDVLICDFAIRERFTIVSKDRDFQLRAAALGHPPRVVHLKIGNCPLAKVEQFMRSAWPFITKLHAEPTAALLVVSSDTAFLLVHRP